MRDRRIILVGVVTQAVTRLFLLDRPHSIAIDENLPGLGMDSLMAIQLANQLSRSVAVHLPMTIAFDHPTIEAIADYLMNAFSPHDSSDDELAPADMPPPMEPLIEGSIAEWSPQQSQRALHGLGGLSDAEVDALLNEVLAGQSDD